MARGADLDDGAATRRTAAQRHQDLHPPRSWPPEGEALAEAIRALSHPRRRELLDSLSVDGPGSVGQQARATRTTAGSVSHHARVLANAGLVEPAPELAGDSRESWWRAVPTTLSWGRSSFRADSAGEERAIAMAFPETRRG